MSNPVKTSIAPWLSIRHSAEAVVFYKKAFGAIETYRLEGEDGSLIARLSVDGAEFWVSEGGPDSDGKRNLGGDNIRMILTVMDPDRVFQNALAAGGVEVFPVGEGHGWRLGRMADPFGLHWEIGKPAED